MRRAYLGLLLTTLLACEEPTPEPTQESDDEGTSSRTTRDAGKANKGDAASGKGKDSTSSAKPDAVDTGKTSESARSRQLPCEVQTVLDQHCVSCHAAGTPQFGAPMSLASRDDFLRDSPKQEGKAHETAAERIQRSGPGTMPPSPQDPLSDSERKTLLTWLEEGAPASDEQCTSATTSDPDANGDTPGEPAPGDEDDCEVGFELRAYDSSRDEKYPIPAEDDHYECFYFNQEELGVDAETLATSLSPLLDDKRVLHHWLLFAAENESEAPSGTHRKCDGIHPGAYLMAAWLPGTPALVLPKDVGMEFPKSKTAQLILENHYNNTARYKGASDNSGVKVCATRKPKTQKAAMHWLGSELITLLPGANGSAMGTCTPKTSEPIHILGVVPHMHRLGRHISMTIQRKGGGSETLHEGAFEFESQGYFPKQVTLQPGDTVRTKCDYTNDTNAIVGLGEKTTQEMCYVFTLAYPVGSMNTGGDYLNPITGQPFVQGPNRCMK